MTGVLVITHYYLFSPTSNPTSSTHVRGISGERRRKRRVYRLEAEGTTDPRQIPRILPRLLLD